MHYDSKYYAESFKESVKNGTAYRQPESFPLDYARLFHPFPYRFPGFNYEQPIKWNWFNIVFDRHFLVSSGAYGSVLLFLILLSVFLVQRTIATLVFSILFFLNSSFFIWIHINMKRNENFRRSICFCFGKSVQAKKLWTKSSKTDQIYAKDSFYTTKNQLGEFNVLRDGSIEIIPNRLDESGNGLPLLSVIGNGKGGVSMSTIDKISGVPIDLSSAGNTE